MNLIVQNSTHLSTLTMVSSCYQSALIMESNHQPVEEDECSICLDDLRMESNQQPEEEECSICMDDLRMYGINTYSRAPCCGKGIHDKCRGGVLKSSLSKKQKSQCVMCRTKYPTSEKEAVKQLRPWVEKGKAWAQCSLGQRYEHGKGVNQSYQQAVELYEFAAGQGDAMAQYNLGHMFKDGHGVGQSHERAAEYFEAAARQGYADAQYNLGCLYYNGDGVEESKS